MSEERMLDAGVRPAFAAFQRRLLAALEALFSFDRMERTRGEVGKAHGRDEDTWQAIHEVVVDEAAFDFSKNDVCGVLLQYPATTGAVLDYSGVVSKAHAAGAKVVAAADLLPSFG